MRIQVNFDHDQLPLEYGMYAPASMQTAKINQHSFPFAIDEIPADAETLAWSLIDYDTVPLLGFPLIHWIVANVLVTADKMVIPADFSLQSSAPQGFNSLHSAFQLLRQPWWPLQKNHRNLETHYFGPRPHSGTHAYHLTVLALNQTLRLPANFGLETIMRTTNESLITRADRNLFYTKKA